MSVALSYPAPFFSSIRRITSDTILDVSSAMGYFVVDSTGGNIEVTMPDARSFVLGTQIWFSLFNLNTSGNTFTATAIAANTMNGAGGGSFVGDAAIDNGGLLLTVTGPAAWTPSQAGIA